MGGTNERQETFVLHLGALQQMPNITTEGAGNVIEDESWFSVCLGLSCSLGGLQVLESRNFPFFFLKVGGDHACILHCAAPSLGLHYKDQCAGQR